VLVSIPVAMAAAPSHDMKHSWSLALSSVTVVVVVVVVVLLLQRVLVALPPLLLPSDDAHADA
jgi:hypothetical protein